MHGSLTKGIAVGDISKWPPLAASMREVITGLDKNAAVLIYDILPSK